MSSFTAPVTITPSVVPALSTTPPVTARLTPVAFSTATVTITAYPTLPAITPCQITEQISTIVSLPGTLFFRDHFHIVAIRGDLTTERELADLTQRPGWNNLSLSPNGQHLAYTSFDMTSGQTVLRLLSADGKDNTIILSTAKAGLDESAKVDWKLADWINDQYLLFGLGNDKKSYLALVDVLSETWDQSPLNELSDRFAEAAVSFSPDLTRALYVVQTEPATYELVLWDIEHNHALWRHSNYGSASMIYSYLSNDVTWKVDSSQAAYDDTEQGTFEGRGLAVVGRDGKDLKPIYPNLARDCSWSPNGRYLAGVAILSKWDEQVQARKGIMIYDSEAHSSYICSLPPNNDTHNIVSYRLVWSPDSRYVIYSLGEDYLKQNNAFALLDIESKQVTVIKQEPVVELIGWSASTDWIQP